MNSPSDNSFYVNDTQQPFWIRKFWAGSCHSHWWESNVLTNILEAAQNFDSRQILKMVQSVALASYVARWGAFSQESKLFHLASSINACYLAPLSIIATIYSHQQAWQPRTWPELPKSFECGISLHQILIKTPLCIKFSFLYRVLLYLS